MEGRDNICFDHLIITDGKDITQKTGYIVKDTLRTLPSQPKVLIRSIHDQGNKKDKIQCKNVMFLLFARVSLFQLLINWLDALPGITNWSKQVLVLLQEQDTEQKDQFDIDRVIPDMKKEKRVDRVHRIETFKNISSWWPLIIKFLFKVRNRSTLYKLVFSMDEMKHSKIAGTLSDIFSSFGLKDSDASEYIVTIDNGTAVNTGRNIYYKSNNCELSREMITVLIDLKVIKAKQTKQITCTVCTKKSRNRVLRNIMYSVLFVMTCFFNLIFLASYVPFVLLAFICLLFYAIAIINLDLPEKNYYTLISIVKDQYIHVPIHITLTFIMFCTLAAVLSRFNSWLPSLIAVYALWPIVIHTILCTSGVDYGLVPLPFKIWVKIDFGLLKILHRHFGTIREQTCVRKIKPILNGLFTLIHIPVLVLYCFLFPLVVFLWDLQTKRQIIFFLFFYTNFALALGFGIAGGVFLISKMYLVAIIFIIISLYIFFFLCVLQTDFWLERNLKYGILSSLIKKLGKCLLK